MKKYIVLILIAALFSSCGIFKNTSKHKEVAKMDSSVTVKSEASKTDKSTIKITERVDTVVKVPGYTQKAEWNPFEQPTFVLDSTVSNLKLYYDSLNHSVKILNIAKDQIIPVHMSRITEQTNDIQESKSEIKETDVSKSNKVVDKHSEPDYSWIIYLVLTISLVAGVGYFLHKKHII